MAVEECVLKTNTSGSVEMKHILNDGREVDLNRVVDVSSVRDEGMDPQSISLSKMAFKIRIKTGGSISVERKYHYADWARVKSDLDHERKALMEKLEEFKASKA